MYLFKTGYVFLTRCCCMTETSGSRTTKMAGWRKYQSIDQSTNLASDETIDQPTNH